MVDRGLVTRPSSEGPWRWHRHRIPRDRSDGHIWTCSSWRGADAGPSRRGRPPHGGALGGPTRQREHGFAGGPGGRGRIRRIRPSGSLGGGCSAQSDSRPQRTRWTRAPRATSEHERGRAKGRSSPRLGSPWPSPDERSGCVSRSRSGRCSRSDHAATVGGRAGWESHYHKWPRR